MTLNIFQRDEPVKVQRGDIWRLGAHRLMCGDATNQDDVLKLMDGGRADLVLTDPSYGTNKKVQKSDGRIGNGGSVAEVREGQKVFLAARKYPHIIGDNDTNAARMNYEIIKNLSDNQIIWGGNFFTDFLKPSRCWLIWDKQNGDTNFADAELAWTSFDKPVRLFPFLWNGVCRKGSHKLNPVPRVHPTQKPVELHMKILEDYSKSGDIILDCFGGSGTTLIASDQTGRRCFMMEIDPHYVEIIINRWEALTMHTAELIEHK